MDLKEQKLKALLIGVQLPKQSVQEIESSLAELARLVTTLGYDVVGETHQRRKSEKGALVLGEGKLKQIAKWTGGTGEIGPLVVKKKHKAAERFAAEKAAESDDETPETDDESEENLSFEERLEAEYADDSENSE